MLGALARSLFGTGVVYYMIQIATALILVLAANTSFADFPRLSSLLARDRFVPRQFATLGERLVFSNGIIVLGGFAALLLVIFGGETHALIPLYAVGVFISFTLSQSGMVMHWWRKRSAGLWWPLSPRKRILIGFSSADAMPGTTASAMTRSASRCIVPTSDVIQRSRAARGRPGQLRNLQAAAGRHCF